MRIVIDTAARSLSAGDRTLGLYTREAFELLSRQWLKVGWSLRYYHNFSWFGHPILQLPEDLLRLEEVVYRLRPDAIVETGVFRGGSLLFSATLAEALGHGRVIGVDCAIEPRDREALAAHRLGGRIELIEGDSIAPETFARVEALIKPGESVLVLLDSCHTKAHVARELELYSRLVTPGSYIVAADGVMCDLADVPGGQAEWAWDNPLAAAREFTSHHPEFVEEQPPWLYHDGDLRENVTYWPCGWLRRTAAGESHG